MGCFTGDSVVTTATGKKSMKDLKVGESVLALAEDGQLRMSKVLLFLDRSATATTDYVTLVTESGRSITATPTHLVLRWQKADGGQRSQQMWNANPVLAKRIGVNDTLLTVVHHGRGLQADRVVEVRRVQRRGLYAPLTVDGTVVVDDIVASCYAVLDSQRLAHWAFLPARMAAAARASFNAVVWRLAHPLTPGAPENLVDNGDPPEGIHWYPRMLYAISGYIIPASWMNTQ